MAPAALLTPFAATIGDELRRELVPDGVGVVCAAICSTASAVAGEEVVGATWADSARPR